MLREINLIKIDFNLSMTLSAAKKLAIIGAGPKAFALATKAKVLSLLGFVVPKIIIYEKNAIAHHWDKASGYTDGNLLLGTSPDKDVGFPYYSFCWGDTVNNLVNRLMKSFSWQSFLVDGHCFAEWIDRGRNAPHHRRWAEYLRWVYRRIGDDIHLLYEEIISLDIDKHQWVIASRAKEGQLSSSVADAVVITGPGSTFLPFALPSHPYILKTENFWLNHGDYKNLRHKAIALIGAGENAATVAVTLAKSHFSNRIDIISPSAMNYTRGESYSENHLYTDPFQGNWHLFTKSDRRNFIARTDRGVFSVDIKKELDCLPNVEVIPGECKNITVDSSQQIILDIHYNSTQEHRIYDMVVVSTGFDHARFVRDLLTDRAKEHICEATKMISLRRDEMEEAIDETLALKSLEPTLHLPMLAALMQGPGFPNLSSLGRLSDHILSHHVSLEERIGINHDGIVKLLGS